MQITIKAKDEKEAEAIVRAMDDESVRAFVVVCGALLGLPSDRARERVLKYVWDVFDDIEEKAS